MLINIDYSKCSLCNQCVAICPNQAIVRLGHKTSFINENILPTEEQVEEMLKARRSYRSFQNKKIDRKTLHKIASLSKYAPTNNFNINTLIIDKKELIEKLEFECLTYIKRINKVFYSSKLIFSLLNKLTPVINNIDKVIIQNTINRGNIFQDASALII